MSEGNKSPPATVPTSPPAPSTATDQPIEVDAQFNDGDSAFDERLSSFTASLTSSVVDYPIEHGRRYHAFRSGAYPMPNDEGESSRLDLAHTLVTKALGDELYLAPLEGEKLHKILDLGTGTGIWAIEMGDKFPNAEILGNDLSPIQPQWVPQNVKFEVDDIESPWVYSAKFDFIFCRYMVATILDWPRLTGNIYDNLNPGAWAEFQDFNFTYLSDDDTYSPENETYKWITTLIDAAAKTGREPSPGPKLEQWVKDAGFTNVTTKKYRLPIGLWPKEEKMKELGMYNLAQTLEGLEAFSLRLYTGVLGWTEEEVLVMLVKVRKELKTSSLHIYYNMWVVYGQKPEE